MAENETVQNAQDSQKELFEAQLKLVREAVEKEDTPSAHGALGELLFTSRDPEHMKEAIPHLEIAAAGGLSAATAYLGDAYFNGRGVEKDIPKAMDLFLDAALDDDVDAMYSLGAAYFMGKEVDADYEKAMDFLSKASSLGNYRATNTLGLMYLGGFGTEQNIAKAKRLFNKAVENGNKHAHQNLELIKKQGRRFDYRGFILTSFNNEEAPEQQ